MTLNFIHGRPACGKDTQVDMLTRTIPHSAKVSGVYRSAFTQKGQYAKYHEVVAPYIKPIGQGIDIPGKVVADIFEGIILDNKKRGIDTLFICGLPRTVDHKRAIDVFLETYHELNSKHIYLAAGENRSLLQATIRLKVDSKNGGGRIDDSVELMRARLARYRKDTLPMLKEIEQEGKLNIIRADCSIEEIHSRLKELLLPQSISPESLSFNIQSRK